MYYVYILKSLRDGGFYVGKSEILKDRIKQHARGEVKSTKDRRPLVLVYFEASNSSKDANHREIYLKTAWGKRYIKNRIKNDITI